MKTALILLVAVVACVAAKSLNKDQIVGQGIPCRKGDIGKRVTFFGSAHRYLECTRKGWELQTCEKGTWFSSEHKGCIGHEEDDECAPASEESPEVEPEEPEVEPEQPSEESPEVEPEEPEVEPEQPSEESPEVEPEEPEVEPEQPSEESPEVEPESPEVEPEEPESPEVEPEEPESPEVEEPEAPSCEVHCSYHGEYLVNPASCHSFYQCSWGVPYLHDCALMNNQTGERLVWDPTLDTCNWPWAYQCNGKPGCSEPEPQPGCDAPTCSYIGEYLSNDADCHSFYQCAWDHDHSLRAVLHKCPIEKEGTENRLVWNANINTCDWSYNVECHNSCLTKN